jgi:hypothetical protein
VSATQTSPQLLKAGFVVFDDATGQVVQILPFQYNPEQLLRTVGAHGETFSLTAVYDATDGLQTGQPTATEHGIAPQLAALAGIATSSAVVVAFVWGASRVAPVQVLSLAVTETMFDSRLNPIAATVSLELQVRGTGASGLFAGRLAGNYIRAQAALAALAPPGTLATLGLEAAP